jgi:hypothetical protein
VQPARHTFSVYQGEYWAPAVQVEDDAGVPIDLTGYDARMQVRTGGDALLVELTVGNGKVTISGTTLTLILDETETAALASGSHNYDLFLTSPVGRDTPLLAGPYDVEPRVTH